MISCLKYPLFATLLLLLLLLTITLATTRPLSAASLLEGRTYDQAHDTGYIDWAGTVQYINLLHKDGMSLPPDEGGTFTWRRLPGGGHPHFERRGGERFF